MVLYIALDETFLFIMHSCWSWSGFGQRINSVFFLYLRCEYTHQRRVANLLCLSELIAPCSVLSILKWNMINLLSWVNPQNGNFNMTSRPYLFNLLIWLVAVLLCEFISSVSASGSWIIGWEPQKCCKQNNRRVLRLVAK